MSVYIVIDGVFQFPSPDIPSGAKGLGKVFQMTRGFQMTLLSVLAILTMAIFMTCSHAEVPTPDQGYRMNKIFGTEDRDLIRGTPGPDYIIAGKGADWWVAGGAGADVFEINYGDQVVRIPDFVVGEDVIYLSSRDVLSGAEISKSGNLLDIRLADGTLIRIDDVDVGEVQDMFQFRSDDRNGDADIPNESVLKIVVFGGQSLAMGSEGHDWVNDTPQFSNSLMLDFENPANSARGWAEKSVDIGLFRGFTERMEVGTETPATGAMNLLAEAHPDKTFISLHYGKSGASLDFVREYTLGALFQQLSLLKDHADDMGFSIDPAVELVWIHGQSGSSGDYSEMLSAHQDEVEAQIQEIFGRDFNVNLYSTITRGYGSKRITQEQLDAIIGDEEIFLGSTEVVFNSQFAARGDPGNPHLTGEGYYMMGAQIGSRILANMSGEPVAPILIDSIELVSPNVYHLHFSNVKGELASDSSVYRDDDFLRGPDNFGIDVYHDNNSSHPGEILSSRIYDRDTIEFVYSEQLNGNFRIWIGRSDADGWMIDGGGSGYGGTTLYDTGQFFEAVEPIGPLHLTQPSHFEFLPQQSFDFDM